MHRFPDCANNKFRAVRMHRPVRVSKKPQTGKMPKLS